MKIDSIYKNSSFVDNTTYFYWEYDVNEYWTQ